MRFFIFFISIQLIAVFSLAQTPGDLRFHKIPDELLKGAELERFFITRDGYLWFGSNNGIASFDGSEILYYGNKGLSGAANYRIADLAEDARGNIWFLAPNYGLVFFDRFTGHFDQKKFTLSTSLKSTQIDLVSLLIDAEGIVWIGAWNYGLFRYDPATATCTHFNLQKNKPALWSSRYENTVRFILQDKYNKDLLWLGCYGSGIYAFDKKTGSMSINFLAKKPADNAIPANKVTGLYQANDSIIWFSTWGHGMAEFNTKTGKYSPYRRNNGFSVHVYGNGHVIEYMAPKSDSEI